MTVITRIIVSLCLLGEFLLFLEHLEEPKRAIGYGMLLAATLIGFIFVGSPAHDAGHEPPPRICFSRRRRRR